MQKKLCLSNFHDVTYVIAGISLLIALLLTVISFMQLCSEQCAEVHTFRLFGLPFEVFGLIFLSAMVSNHILLLRYNSLQLVQSLFFATALGAEIMFILVQKVYIGTWCAVCLGIASCIMIGSVAFAASYAKNLQSLIHNEDKGGIMNAIWRAFGSAGAVFIGFLAAFMGVSEHNAIEAAQASIQDSLAFGNTNSPIEVYLFTDWACPACRKLEPRITEMSKQIMTEAKLIFVDHAVHPETLNFVPFHLSFILKNKNQYFELRDMLTKISEKTGSPTEREIADSAQRLGVRFEELNYSDVALAVKYYKSLGEKFKVQGTPTLVIINRESKKGKKLSGFDEITTENALKAIDTLKNS